MDWQLNQNCTENVSLKKESKENVWVFGLAIQMDKLKKNPR